jgi:hypothetical protein
MPDDLAAKLRAADEDNFAVALGHACVSLLLNDRVEMPEPATACAACRMRMGPVRARCVCFALIALSSLFRWRSPRAHRR